MQIGAYGICAHTTNRIRIANATLTKLRRFRGLKPTTMLRLYKTLARPQLEYPPIIHTIIKKSPLKKLQAIQNKATRRASGDIPPYFTTMETLHNRFKLEPLNIRIHRLGNRTWDRLTSVYPILIDDSNSIDAEGGPDHKWWPRLSPAVNSDPPTPYYS